MKSATIFFNNYDYLDTEINGTDDEIRAYYAIGKPFNLGGEDDNITTVKDFIIHGKGQRERETAMKFAYNVKRMGFRVFLSESEEYGFITDETESRVLSFGASYGMIKLSGVYQPNSGHGSGWGIAKELDVIQSKDFIQKCLYLPSPYASTKLSTVKDYLNRYQSSSKFNKIMLELTQKEIDARCEIGKIEGVPVRFFGEAITEDGIDIVELTESEFNDLDLPITYERHTVFQNGVSQICLTKTAHY